MSTTAAIAYGVAFVIVIIAMALALCYMAGDADRLAEYPSEEEDDGGR